MLYRVQRDDGSGFCHPDWDVTEAKTPADAVASWLSSVGFANNPLPMTVNVAWDGPGNRHETGMPRVVHQFKVTAGGAK